MGLRYSVVMDAAAITAAKDLIRLSAPADAVIVVHEISVTQETEQGDAQSEAVAVQLQRSSTDGTGTAYTPQALESGQPAAGGGAVVNLTADTTISGTPLRRWGFNLLAGLHVVFAPESRPIVSPSGRIVLRLDAPTTLADSVTFSAEIVYEEIGG